MIYILQVLLLLFIIIIIIVILIYVLQKTQEVMITDGFKNLHEENADVFTTIIHRIALTLP